MQKIISKYCIFYGFRVQKWENSIRHFGTLFTLCLKSSMLERYLDIKNGKWSENGIEIENAFEYAKIVDISASCGHSGSGGPRAANLSEPSEAGCAI